MLRKILFVDDDEILQLVAGKGLAPYGDAFQVVMARDGFEALKMLEGIAVSLIVIDLHMPRMDGLSLLSHIQQSYPDIPVVIISATPKIDLPYLAVAQNIVAYFEKPFGCEELARRIIEVLQEESAGGIMHQVSPAMFLQMMEMERKTCTIRMLDRKSAEGGILYLRDGRLLNARIGSLWGKAAAYRLIGWDEVTAFLRNDCGPRQDVINSDLQPIIMDALARKDEADDSSDGDSDGPLAGFAALDSALSDLGELPGGDEPEADRRNIGSGVAGIPAGAGADSGSSTLEEIRNLLRREVGESCGVHKMYHDPGLDQAVRIVTALGQRQEFGDLRVGHVDNDEELERLLVAGPEQQATVLQVGSEAPLTTLMDVLRYRDVSETGREGR